MKAIVQCGIKIDDEYWFVTGNTNGLFKKKLSTDSIEFMGFFPGESRNGFRLYSDLQLVDGKLVFTPCHAMNMAVYQINESKFMKISIMDHNKECFNKYLRSIQYCGQVYFIPFCADLFIKYDVKQNKIKVLDEWNGLRALYMESGSCNFIIEGTCVKNKYAYMFLQNKNQIVILNMETDQFRIQDLAIAEDENICSVDESGENIWITTNKNKLYKWNPKNEEIELAIDFACYIEAYAFYAHYTCATKKYIYFINIYDRNIRAYEYMKNRFLTINMDKYVREKRDNCLSIYYYFDIHKMDSKIYLYSFYNGNYIMLDGDTVIKCDKRFFLPENYCEKQYVKDEIYLDTTFSEWLKFLPMRDKHVSEKQQFSGIGRKIYKMLA